MVAHEVFALIHDRDVMNIVVGDYYNCNEAAKLQYGESAFAIEITRYPVQIGDVYLNGVFSRLVDGEYVRIDPLPTEADEIAQLTAEVAELQQTLETVQSGVSDARYEELAEYVEAIVTELLNTTGGA